MEGTGQQRCCLILISSLATPTGCSFRVCHVLISHHPRTQRAFAAFVLTQSCVLIMMLGWELSQISPAQEPGGMPRLSIPETTPNVLTPGIRQDAIIMRSGMGESVFVPKSKYEDFERYLSSEKNSRMAFEKEALERIDISVNVEQAIARLDITAKTDLAEANLRSISIPIALGTVQAIPTQRPGTAAEFPPVRILNEGAGYVWRLPPGLAGKRELQFQAVSNLRISPQGQSLQLNLPLVPSIVRIELPIGQWELIAIGNGSEVVEPFQDMGSNTVAIVRTSGGAISFNWIKKTVAEQIQAIEVESQTKYEPLLEAGEFRAVANLAIRGPKVLGGRRFLITLPSRSLWREPMASPISFPGYRVRRWEGTEKESKTVLLLEFEEAFSRSEMELPIEWQTSQSRESNPIEFSMVRVEGVQRHIGSVDLSVPRNGSIRWEPQSGIQFVRQSQSSDGSESLTYTFRFNQQSEPLVVEWNVGDRASDLKAVYSVVYDSSSMRLNGAIDILGDIRLLPFLQLDVRGWSVDRVQLQPSGRDVDVIATRSRSAMEPGGVQQQSTTSIPLSLGELLDALQPKNGIGNRSQVEMAPMQADSTVPTSTMNTREENVRQPTRSIAFVLSRSIKPDSTVDGAKREVAFSLPMLSWLDPELQQRMSLSVGGEMTIQSSTSKLEETESLSKSFYRIGDTWNQARPIGRVLHYRVERSKSWLDWSGNTESIGILIEGNSQTSVLLADESIDISQTWHLFPSGGTPKSLRIALPKEWLEDGDPLSGVPDRAGIPDRGNRVQIVVDGVAASGQPVPDLLTEHVSQFISPSFAQRYVWFRIPLLEPPFSADLPYERKVVIHKRLGHRNPLTSSQSSFDWPLPWIASDRIDDTLSIGTISGKVVHDENLRCAIKSPLGGIEESRRVDSNGASIIAFDRSRLEPRLEGSLSLQSITNESAVDVESVWLQTIVNAVEQRDRFVFRFKTRDSTVSLNLPAARTTNGEFLVNGRKATPSHSPNDVNRVDIPLDSTELNLSTATDRVYVLEVFIWSPNRSQWLKSLYADLPRIIHCSSKAPMVWQVVLPTTVHLIGNASTLSPGYRWKWQDLWFGRKSELTQDKIASQIGATTQPFVSQQTNQYVFYSLDHTVAMKVWTAPRYLLWAPVALFVLMGSFFVMEFSWIRKPWISIFLLLSSLAFSQWAWDLSVAIVQCFVAAIAIAVLYSILKWTVDRRARRRSVFHLWPPSLLIPSAVRIPSPTSPAVLAKPGSIATTGVDNLAIAERPPSTTISPGGDFGK